MLPHPAFSIKIWVSNADLCTFIANTSITEPLKRHYFKTALSVRSNSETETISKAFQNTSCSCVYLCFPLFYRELVKDWEVDGLAVSQFLPYIVLEIAN